MAGSQGPAEGALVTRIYGVPCSGLLEDAVNNQRWQASVRELSLLPINKVHLFVTNWALMEGYGQFPFDTLRLRGLMMADGRSLRLASFNEGPFHGTWSLGADCTLTVACS